MSEQQKADRRTLIANNKAWDSATTVRRDWLTGFLARKSLPKDVLAFIAAALTGHRHQIADARTHGNTLAATLLGLDTTGNRDPLGDWTTSHPTRALHAAAAICLAGIEAATSRTDWRSPDRRTAAYLTRLTGWGYTLSDVERLITDAHPTSRDWTPQHPCPRPPPARPGAAAPVEPARRPAPLP